jgi:hypothetical protein
LAPVLLNSYKNKVYSVLYTVLYFLAWLWIRPPSTSWFVAAVGKNSGRKILSKNITFLEKKSFCSFFPQIFLEINIIYRKFKKKTFKKYNCTMFFVSLRRDEFSWPHWEFGSGGAGREDGF